MLNKSDEALISEYKSGNLNAFNEIYERYKGIVKYYSRNMFLLGAETEDLIQEGMMGLIKAVNTYSSEKSSFKTYASVCIKNSLISAVKKFSTNKSLPLNTSASLDELENICIFGKTPEDELLNKENGAELNFKIYSALSKYEIIVLRLYLEGLTYLEIAEKTQKTVKSVDGALARARKKIINCIGE